MDQEGYCLTSYHVVAQASSATAVLTESKTRLPVELRAVDVSHDLALVKVNIADAGAVKPLELDSGEVSAGDDVWALGYPLGLGYTVNKGTVNGVRKVSELPDELRDELLKRSKLDPRSLWLQTDCTINSGNSGGPLVNKAGKVVGINTFSLKQANNVFFALKVSEARSILGRKGETMEFSPRDRAQEAAAKQEAIGGGGRGAGEGESAAAGSGNKVQALPAPGWDYSRGVPIWRPVLKDIPTSSPLPTGAVSPVQLRNTVEAMKKKVLHDCGICQGTGKVTVKYNRGAWPNTWVETVKETCKTCKGKRRVRGSDEEIVKVTSAVVKQLVQQKWEETGGNTRAAIDLATDALAKEWAWDRVATKALDDNFYNAVTRKTIKVGDGVCLRGKFVGLVRPAPGEAGTPAYVMWTGRHRRMYIVNMPRLAEQEFYKVVVFGGIYTGSMQSDVPDNVPVLQNGFILEVKRDEGEQLEYNQGSGEWWMEPD